MHSQFSHSLFFQICMPVCYKCYMGDSLIINPLQATRGLCFIVFLRLTWFNHAAVLPPAVCIQSAWMICMTFVGVH